MRESGRRLARWLLVLLLVAAAVGAGWYVVDGAAANADDAMAGAAPENPLERGDMVPDLALIDANGERFTLHGMEPRHKLITFFYARCPMENFCPAQSQRLAQLQNHAEQTGSEIHLVSLTLDSEHDDTDVLADYAARFGANPERWTLAGGEDPEEVREFAHRAGARIHAHSRSSMIDHALIGIRVDGNRIVDHVVGLDAIQELVEGM